jgi:hypothetical protein
MEQADFAKLTPRQQLTLVIAMHVRNEMESFHGKHLSDAQMKELNPIIRQAIYDALDTLKPPGPGSKRREEWEKTYAWLIRMIPDYWEVPDKSTGSLLGFK